MTEYKETAEKLKKLQECGKITKAEMYLMLSYAELNHRAEKFFSSIYDTKKPETKDD
jgi:hypothetical protein